MSRVRPLAAIAAALVVASAIRVDASALPLHPPEAEPSGLDVHAATLAIDEIRHALPEGWATETIRWGTVPQGWQGKPECLLIEVQDQTTSFTHPDEGFLYRPFYKIWLLPACWEGRMDVAQFDPSAPQAFYLGERPEFRVLIRTLGRTTWAEGPETLGHALALDTYPLSHRPEHTLDVLAMQKLFQRLDASTGGELDRWRRQIYGIEERDDLLYLELLTWEDRGAHSDPTFMGELAERETQFLTRELLAAFPTKRGLYLRRLTRQSFSDVIVVNPAKFGS